LLAYLTFCIVLKQPSAIRSFRRAYHEIYLAVKDALSWGRSAVVPLIFSRKVIAHPAVLSQSRLSVTFGREVSRNWWDHAAIATAASGRPMGSNRWPKPKPSVPL
jgi:hypothetical protein